MRFSTILILIVMALGVLVVGKEFSWTWASFVGIVCALYVYVCAVKTEAGTVSIMANQWGEHPTKIHGEAGWRIFWGFPWIRRHPQQGIVSTRRVEKNFNVWDPLAKVFMDPIAAMAKVPSNPMDEPKDGDPSTMVRPSGQVSLSYSIAFEEETDSAALKKAKDEEWPLKTEEALLARYFEMTEADGSRGDLEEDLKDHLNEAFRRHVEGKNVFAILSSASTVIEAVQAQVRDECRAAVLPVKIHKVLLGNSLETARKEIQTAFEKAAAAPFMKQAQVTDAEAEHQAEEIRKKAEKARAEGRAVSLREMRKVLGMREEGALTVEQQVLLARFEEMDVRRHQADNVKELHLTEISGLSELTRGVTAAVGAALRPAAPPPSPKTPTPAPDPTPTTPPAVPQPFAPPPPKPDDE